MNFFAKKATITESNEKSKYHNSFRGTKIKKPDEKTPKLLESLTPKPMLIFDNKEKTEVFDSKKVQPKLLTSKLPSAFTLSNSKAKRGEKLNLNKKSSLNDDNLKPHYEHTENNYISLTEEAYSPRFIQQEFDEKHMKIPCQNTYRDKMSRNSSKSTKSDPKSNSQNQFLSDNDYPEHTVKTILKDKSNTDNIKIKYQSPEVNSNELQRLINYDFSSNDSAKKLKNPKTHDSFFPKIKNTLNENLEYNLNTKYHSNNINLCIAVECEPTPYSELKLEDCITMNILKNSFSKIKKMLYVSSFEVLAIKEIPVNSKSFNINLKEKITEIKNKFAVSQRFVKLHKEFLNTPEGCVSIVMEYMNGFSLQDTIENIGCLSECMVKGLTAQIIDALEEHIDILSVNYGEISLCDVLLNKDGVVKLLPNIFKPLKYQANEFPNKSKCSCTDIFHNKLSKIIELKNCLNASYANEKLNNNFLSINDLSGGSNVVLDNSTQFFYLGYFLIICCLGGMKFNHFEYIEKNIKFLEKELKTKKFCCFFHLLNSMDSIFNNKLKISSIFSERVFSPKFFDFLCLLTNFNKEKHKEISIRMLKNHIWFKEPVVKGKLKLTEMIKLTREWKKNKGLNNDYKHSNFENSFNMILSKNIEHYKDTSPYMSSNKSLYNYIVNGDFINFIENRKKVIKEISYDLCIQPIILYNKLKEIISEYF